MDGPQVSCCFLQCLPPFGGYQRRFSAGSLEGEPQEGDVLVLHGSEGEGRAVGRGGYIASAPTGRGEELRSSADDRVPLDVLRAMDAVKDKGGKGFMAMSKMRGRGEEYHEAEEGMAGLVLSDVEEVRGGWPQRLCCFWLQGLTRGCAGKRWSDGSWRWQPLQ